jgi:hypothetical protein
MCYDTAGVENGLQLCSRLTSILNVPPEDTPAGLASPAAALDGHFEFLNRTLG